MRRVIVTICFFATCNWDCSLCIAQKNSSPKATTARGELVGTPFGDYVIGSPTSHANLSIFPISSKTSKNEDRYITLDEGLAAGSVRVIEVGADQDTGEESDTNGASEQPQQSRGQSTSSRGQANQRQSRSAENFDDPFGADEVGGDVNTLLVENKSGKPLYLMPGEVLSGGKQDRTIGQEIVIAPSGKAVPIDVFCVEHGRWAGRSLESTSSQLGSTEFNANQSLVVSQTAPVEELAKQAQRGEFIASVGQLNKDSRRAVQESGAQGKVWNEVAKANSKVGNKSYSGNFAANYFSRDIVTDFEPFIKKLKPVGDTKQIVGIAVAVNGKMLSVDIFESTPLFKKFWPKLLKSYALDAVAAKSETNKGEKLKAVTIGDCFVFLKEAENSKAEVQQLADGQAVYKRDSRIATSYSYYDERAGAAAGAGQTDVGKPNQGGGFGGSVHTSVLSK